MNISEQQIVDNRINQLPSYEVLKTISNDWEYKNIEQAPRFTFELPKPSINESINNFSTFAELTLTQPDASGGTASVFQFVKNPWGCVKSVKITCGGKTLSFIDNFGDWFKHLILRAEGDFIKSTTNAYFEDSEFDYVAGEPVSNRARKIFAPISTAGTGYTIRSVIAQTIFSQVFHQEYSKIADYADDNIRIEFQMDQNWRTSAAIANTVSDASDNIHAARASVKMRMFVKTYTDSIEKTNFINDVKQGKKEDGEFINNYDSIRQVISGSDTADTIMTHEPYESLKKVFVAFRPIVDRVVPSGFDGIFFSPSDQWALPQNCQLRFRINGVNLPSANGWFDTRNDDGLIADNYGLEAMFTECIANDDNKTVSFQTSKSQDVNLFNYDLDGPTDSTNIAQLGCPLFFMEVNATAYAMLHNYPGIDVTGKRGIEISIRKDSSCDYEAVMFTKYTRTLKYGGTSPGFAISS